MDEVDVRHNSFRVRAQFHEPPQRNYLWLIPAVIIFTLFFAVLFIGCNKDPVWASGFTASYYTYESCRREGTSGVWTASGERYNENDLTAAMWDVPFGTKVKVTNLKNNKSIIVRINDRGPSRRLARQGRIIDLSKAAFTAIADLRLGVIPVEVEVL
jgi:rare lipoprotein A